MATVEPVIDYEGWVTAALRNWANQLDEDFVQVVRHTAAGESRITLHVNGERVATITVTPER